jgi:hypothetical protein
VLPPDADEIKEILHPKQSEDRRSQPPPPPVRGKSLKKPGSTINDDDDEEYEVMEQPEEEIDTYRLASEETPNYVNDKLCQVKPLSFTQQDDDESEGELYEPMEEVENLNLSSPAGLQKQQDVTLPPRQASKTNVPPPEIPSPTTKVPLPTPRDKKQSSEEDCADLKIQRKGSFDIAEKSIQDIIEVLSLLRLNKYATKFREEMVDGELLAELTVEDLQNEFQFSKLEAMRLYKYIEKGHIPK